MLDDKFFAKFLLALSKVLPNRTPNFEDRDTIKLWFEAFKEFEAFELEEIYPICRDTLDRFPTIRELKTLLTAGSLDEDEIAEDVAARIEGAMAKYGYCNPEQARAYIGEIGWRVISLTGGWTRVCECENDELVSLRRQWRELSKATMSKARAGTLDFPPELPSASKCSQLISGLCNSTLTLSAGKKDTIKNGNR